MHIRTRSNRFNMKYPSSLRSIFSDFSLIRSSDFVKNLGEHKASKGNHQTKMADQNHYSILPKGKIAYENLSTFLDFQENNASFFIDI